MICQLCHYEYFVNHGEDNGPCPACGGNPVSSTPEPLPVTDSWQRVVPLPKADQAEQAFTPEEYDAIDKSTWHKLIPRWCHRQGFIERVRDGEADHEIPTRLPYRRDNNFMYVAESFLAMTALPKATPSTNESTVSPS
jgi:hypothetical protein